MRRKLLFGLIAALVLGLVSSWPDVSRADWTDSVGLLFGAQGIEPGDPAQGEAPAGKTNWYVDADAPDGGDGSYANPYNSFEQVVGWINGSNYVQGQIQGGDYLYVKGTFLASNHVEGSRNMDIHFGRSAQAGTAAQPTVIKSWPGSPRAVFDAEYLRNDMIRLRSTSSPGGHFVIQNIEARRGAGRTVYLGDNLSGCEVISVVIRDTHGDGVMGTGGGILFRLNVGQPHFIMRNSLVYNNDVSPEGVTGNRGGISILSEGTALTGASIDIYDNEIFDESYAVRHKHSGNIINRVYHNIIHDSGGAVHLRGYNGNYVHHNILYNLGVGMFHYQDNQQANSYSEFYNNTLYNVVKIVSTGAGQTPSGYRRDFDIHDNIYFNDLEASDWLIQLGRWSGDEYPIAEWQSYSNSYYYLPSRVTFLYAVPNAYTYEQAAVYLSDPTMFLFDPLFVDAANHNFQLQSGSPALGAASDGGDLGALGQGGTTPGPSTEITEEFGDATGTDHPGTVEDTYANSGASSANYSGDSTLNTYTWPELSSANTTILKWDLTSIPAGATVIQATLYLHQTSSRGASPYNVPVHKIVNHDPNISALTWSTYDGSNAWAGGANGGQGDTAPAEDTQPLSPTNAEYKSWNVTEMVQDWVSTPPSNYGMLLNSDTAAAKDDYRYFASSDNADPALRPKLVVTYSSGLLPGQAGNPSPSDGATSVSALTDLSWMEGVDSDSSDLYFGTNSPGDFQGNQTASGFDPGLLNTDTTYYWHVDEVNTAGTTAGPVWTFTTIPAAPAPASAPTPAAGANGASTSTNLSWVAGSGSASSNVYFGTTSPGTFQGNQTATTFDPGALSDGTTYYWRVDEINAGGTTTGPVWSFATASVVAPSPASAPNPASGANNVSTSTILGWTEGAGSTSSDVYFGTTSPGTFQGNQTEITFDPGVLASGTTYYWRIDEINAGGTAIGSVWNFTTQEASGSVIEEFGSASGSDNPGTVEDSYANSGAGSTNYSTDQELNTYTWPDATSANTTVLKWDLTGIPSDATVTDATLFLYQTSSRGDSPYNVPVHRIVNHDPSIGALTWDTYDGSNAWTGGANGGQGDIAAAEYTQTLSLTNGEYKRWNVTGMVQDWVAASAGNYGMLLNSDAAASQDSYRYFASSDNDDPAIRPRLVIEYSTAGPPVPVDWDGDGVPDSSDNCMYAMNPGQEDSGGIASSADPSGVVPDGIGDACQCGDVNDDGKVTGIDGTLIARWAVGLPPGLVTPEKCTVIGDSCNGVDATIVARTVVGLPPGILQNCTAALAPPDVRPVHAAQSVSFSDIDDSVALGGPVVIQAAADESDVDFYNVYWGDSSSCGKVGARLRQESATGSPNYTWNVPVGTVSPANAEKLLVFTGNLGGEMDTCVSADVQNVIALTVPTQKSSGVSFVDIDGATTIGGTVNIGRAADESNITEYVVRWGGADQCNLGSDNAVLPKTGGDLSYDFPIGTPLPAGAEYLLVYTKNDVGEMADCDNVAVQIENYITTIPPPETALESIWHYENFADVPLGANPSDYTGLSAAGRSVMMSSDPYPGDSKSVQTELRVTDNNTSNTGGGGWGAWGFVWGEGGADFPRQYNDDSEIWIRLAVYYPSTWSWSTSGGGGRVKFFRLHKAHPDGDNNGYIDTYQSGNEITSITEAPYSDSWHDTGIDLPRGRWVMYEMYTKLNNVSGRRKIWMDGELISDYPVGLSNISDFHTDRFLFHTYWNGQPSQTQQSQYAQFAVAVRGNANGVSRDDTQWMARDANGFPFIGMATRSNGSGSDLCIGDDASGDTDGDGVCDDTDVCPVDPNDDSDGDGSCDSVDLCTGDDSTGDSDGDGLCDDIDPPLGVPVNKAAGLSFTDTDPADTLGGPIVITRAADESDITEYVLYWGGADGCKLSADPGYPVAKTGSNITLDLEPGTEQLVGVETILVYTQNAVGEMAGCDNVSVAIVNYIDGDPPPPAGETDRSKLLFFTNFENGAHGDATTTGSTGFSSVAENQTYDNTTSVSGASQSMKDVIMAGSRTGYGFRFYFDEPGKGDIRIGEGDQIWVSFATKFEPGFDFTTGSDGTESAPSLKWLGFEPNVTTDRTYIDPLDNADLETDWYYDSEAASGDVVSSLTSGSGRVKRGVWQQWEVRLKNSGVGNGEVDLWRDGIKVASLSGLTTMDARDSHLHKFNMGKYWNGGAPSTQTMWWDNIAVAVKTSGALSRDDTVHMASDADGNPFIGIGGTPPDPPPASVPVHKAAGVSFTDLDDAITVGGTVNITRAADESDITEYVLRWGGAGQCNLGSTIASIPKTGGNLSHALPSGTALPAGAEYILVYTKNDTGEMANCDNVAVQIQNNIATPPPNPGVPVNKAAGLSFTDTDPTATLGGPIRITRAVDESDITEYVLYWGGADGCKLNADPGYPVAKTGADITVDMGAGTLVPAGVETILVYSKNDVGEMAGCDNVSVAIVNYIDTVPPPPPGECGGNLVFDSGFEDNSLAGMWVDGDAQTTTERSRVGSRSAVYHFTPAGHFGLTNMTPYREFYVEFWSYLENVPCSNCSVDGKHYFRFAWWPDKDRGIQKEMDAGLRNGSVIMSWLGFEPPSPGYWHSFGNSIRQGVWQKNRVAYRPNTPGSADGHFIWTFDDVVVNEVRDEFFGASDQMDTFIFTNYDGISNARIFIDELVVRTGSGAYNCFAGN